MRQSRRDRTLEWIFADESADAQDALVVQAEPWVAVVVPTKQFTGAIEELGVQVGHAQPRNNPLLGIETQFSPAI